MRGYTPNQLRLVRRVIDAGRGASIKLDELRGDVVHVRSWEYGDRGVSMERGTAVLEVWTLGDPEHVLEKVRATAPAGVLVLAVVRPARLRHRLLSRLRWRRFLLRMRVAGLLRRFGMLEPTWHGEPISRVARFTREKK